MTKVQPHSENCKYETSKQIVGCVVCPVFLSKMEAKGLLMFRGSDMAVCGPMTARKIASGAGRESRGPHGHTAWTGSLSVPCQILPGFLNHDDVECCMSCPTTEDTPLPTRHARTHARGKCTRRPKVLNGLDV